MVDQRERRAALHVRDDGDPDARDDRVQLEDDLVDEIVLEQARREPATPAEVDPAALSLTERANERRGDGRPVEQAPARRGPRYGARWLAGALPTGWISPSRQQSRTGYVHA